MLSWKRKHHAKGKDVRFQYKGPEIEQERIERAHKRQKGPLLSPIGNDLESWIGFCERLKDPYSHSSMYHSLPSLTLRQCDNSGEHCFNWTPTGLDEAFLDSSTRSAESNCVSSNTRLNQEVANFTSNDLKIMNMTDDLDDLPDVQSPQFPEASFTGSVSGYNTRLAVQQQSFSPFENFSARSMREASFCLSEFFDFSPVSKSPNRMAVEPFSNAEINRRAPSRGSSFSHEVTNKSELQAVNRPHGLIITTHLKLQQLLTGVSAQMWILRNLSYRSNSYRSNLPFH